MDGQRIAGPADRRIALLAADQHRVVAARQLRALGLARGAIEHRLRVGRLFLVHRGVYSLWNPVPSRAGQLTAAVLGCGQGAALSHWAACEWWGLVRGQASTIEVTVPAAGGRWCRGVVVHRSSNLAPGECCSVRGLRVTSVARTIIDVAPSASSRELERMLDEGDRLRVLDAGELVAVLDQHRGRRGVGSVRRLLARHDAGSTWTRSELEERFLALCRRSALAAPHVNHVVGRHELDFCWPDQRVNAECDGRGAHATRRAFEADRARDAELTALGIRILRFTYRQVAREAPVVAHRLRTTLAVER